jgi:hypothetical protein
MSNSLTIIIVEKNASLKSLTVKDYKEEELYKKCGFKRDEGFKKHFEFNVKMDGQKYAIMMFGKLNGKANCENKYDFPPPLDTKLFFGNCVLVGMIKDDNGEKSFINLTLKLWEKLYEKLFGGFEDLTTTIDEDEEEDDELENIPKSQKTKNGGYLKDGFVVDDDNDVEEEEEEEEEEDEEEEEIENINVPEDMNNEDDCELEDIGSELSEESYDYSDDEE